MAEASGRAAGARAGRSGRPARRHAGPAARGGAADAPPAGSCASSPSIPDIVRLKRAIASLEQKAEAEPAEASLLDRSSPQCFRPRRPSAPGRTGSRKLTGRAREPRSADRAEGDRRKAAARDRRRLSGARRGDADARVRADRADARLRHAAEDLHEPARARRRTRRSPPTSSGARSASSSRSSTRRAAGKAVQSRPRTDQPHGRIWSVSASASAWSRCSSTATRRSRPTTTCCRR